MDTQRLIDEALPMLDDTLGHIGLHRAGTLLNFASLRDPFSDWLQQQTVTQQDVNFVVSLVGAFITEYLIAQSNAVRGLNGNRIVVRVPFADGIVREFDPYASALGLLREHKSLSQFLSLAGT